MGTGEPREWTGGYALPTYPFVAPPELAGARSGGTRS